MEKVTGKPIFKGIAIGKLLLYKKEERLVKRVDIEDTDTEIKRYKMAKEIALKQLDELHQKAIKEVGEKNATVFEIYAMMAEDGDYVESILNIIETQRVNAEFAVKTTGNNFSKMFAEMEDEYFKIRALDVKDISEQIVDILYGNKGNSGAEEESAIIMTDDLTLNEIIKMDKNKPLAFVIRYDSSDSRIAILAKTINIPTLIGVDTKEEWNGKLAIVDGYSGILYIDPDDDVLKQMKLRQKEDRNKISI